MKIHLIRSTEMDEDRYTDVLDIVQKYAGPLEFHEAVASIHFELADIEKQDFEHSKWKIQKALESYYKSEANISESRRDWRPEFPEVVKNVKWNTIFKKCEDYRYTNGLPTDELVVLLTKYGNDQNWFSGWDPSQKLNFFIHADQWEYYLTCDAKFPIAFQLMTTLVQRMLYHTYEEVAKHMHKQPRGCINDFCKNKKDITFKLRTADICPECQQLLIEKKLDPLLINQVMNTIDGIRAQMLFRERFKITRQLSRLTIRGVMKRIFFTDLADAELQLNPLERTLYLLFLEHPEGIRLNELINHREWIENTYKAIGNSRTVAEFRNSIDQLTDPTENSASEKISRIKSKIVRLTGEELAENYLIAGDRGAGKLIKLDRKYISFE